MPIKLYDGLNVSNLELLGQGTQGTVYKIDDSHCIKIFKKRKSCADELHSLLLGQIDSHFPILYSYGDDYIIRENIHGLTLDMYLLKKPFTNNVGKQIIDLYNSMRYVGFKRLDCALFHIFLANDYNFKLIDTSKAMKKTYDYPKIMIQDLNTLNCKNDFLNYVKNNHPLIYTSWEKSINKE